MLVRLLVFLTLTQLAIASPAIADSVVAQADNWLKQAAESLLYKGEPLTLNGQGGFNETAKKPLCVRLNNYGCVKQGRDPWNGSSGKRDSKGHAVFDDPAYSVRAVVRDYCSKHRRGVRSAVALANAYSPWCDTLGSLPVYKGWGRSCGDPPLPPANFDGPFCQDPNGEPSQEQCAACNCPSNIAKHWLKGLTGIDDPYANLELFDDQGVANPETLATLLRNKMRIELGGFVPTDEVLNNGISLAGDCR
jgi:hypothetical protein